MHLNKKPTKFKKVSKQVKQKSVVKIKKLNGSVEFLCGVYSRVARRLGVHRTYVSRVARGQRRSEKVESALVAEYNRAKKQLA